MDDARLDREIEALVSIDPSPDFRARVRERLANEPPIRALAGAWRLPWAVAAGGALVVGALLVAIVFRTTPEPRAATELAARSIDEAGYDATARPVASEGASGRISRGGARRRPAAAPIEQTIEVIVYPPEAAAWRRLMARVGSGDVDLSRLARAGTEQTPLMLPEELALPLIVIEPLTPGFGEQGVHP
ncbi:MAG: hypothetical protein ACRD26_17755 [Vicinamibacterales bacterium]